jgi:ethanolamine utilization cobalamin adenosyltransferase
MTEERIREASHDPKSAFGIGHFMPDRSMGEDMAHLNLLRTEVRAAELAACDAFCGMEPGAGISSVP